ncbi:hypothetical protein F5Y13DRAFT_120238 [Hypoxylon sp. FL1857]|nr:hypothetical protein F5Y13DRAFT_120238 [Hypoxylon sp. FL1857]
MCRRTLIHQMHHDVRLPSIVDLHSEDPIVYYNARRTRYHQCELSRPPPGTWLLNTSYPSCRYHSCCVLSIDVEYCADFCADLACEGIDEPDEFQPEECDYFSLEHDYLRLEYFGKPEAYSIRVPTVWREDMQTFREDWLPWYRRSRLMLPDFEAELFFEGEILYTLEQDVKTHFFVYRDLARIYPPGHPQLLAAEINVDAAQQRVIQRKEHIYSLVSWARHYAAEPCQGFTPTWSMRMRALKHGTSKEYLDRDVAISPRSMHVPSRNPPGPLM